MKAPRRMFLRALATAPLLPAGVARAHAEPPAVAEGLLLAAVLHMRAGGTVAAFAADRSELRRLLERHEAALFAVADHVAAHAVWIPGHGPAIALRVSIATLRAGSS